MRSLLAVLLVIASILAYFVLSTGFGVFQPVPWPHLLVAAGACVWLIVELRRRVAIGRVIALVVATALTGAFAWYTLDYSSYGGEVPPSFAAGDRFAELMSVTLPDASGEVVALLPPASAEHRATLIVFYRGFW